ncbi:hypothetical protein XPA_006088 [Xanthoria parietina]
MTFQCVRSVFYQRFSSWFVAAVPETFAMKNFFQVKSSLFGCSTSKGGIQSHYWPDDSFCKPDRQWLLAALLLTVLRGVAHLFKLAVRVSYSAMAAPYRSLRTECSCWTDVPIESVGWRGCHAWWQQ